MKFRKLGFNVQRWMKLVQDCIQMWPLDPADKVLVILKILFLNIPLSYWTPYLFVLFKDTVFTTTTTTTTTATATTSTVSVAEII
jgi:hypothetical protein